MKRIAAGLSVMVAALALVALTLSSTSAAMSAPVQRITFTKEASNPTPRVGEAFTFTLSFSTTEAETQTIRVRVIDPNPAPLHLKILTPTITGGAWYSPTTDSIVWEGALQPAGTQAQAVAFQVQGMGIPAEALTAGYWVTNTAMMIDLATPGSLNEIRAEEPIRMMPAQLFLPIVTRNYRPFGNGDFEDGLNGWDTGQGTFNGHGSGVPQGVVSFEGDNRALLGDPDASNGSIPVGYGYVAQAFTVDKPHLRLQYRVVSYDIIKGTQRYYDNFEVSVNRPPDQISDAERDANGCASTMLNPTGTLTVAEAGLVFCGGRPGTSPDVGTQWDSEWKTVTLDLGAFQEENITLYLSIWSREYDLPYYNDQGWYNTWAYMDGLILEE
jgi:hypothetical protein